MTQFRDWGHALPEDLRSSLFYVAGLIAGISQSEPLGVVPPSAWVNEDTTKSGTYENGVHWSRSAPAFGLKPTPWGFVSGYEAHLWSGGEEVIYLGGVLDPGPILVPGEE